MKKKCPQGGVNDGGVEALTSYVLVALLEAGEGQMTSATLDAISCLLSYPVPSKQPYNLALKSYALALAGRSEAVQVLGELMAQAVVAPNSTYWELPAGHSEWLRHLPVKRIPSLLYHCLTSLIFFSFLF